MDEQLEKAKKLLNDNGYVVIPVNKAQMSFCVTCKNDKKWCTFNSMGYACSSLLCINDYIKEQIDYKSKIAAIMGDE